MDKQKILVILGPTASGKSGLAVRLAKKFGGEIISADSRQVYKGLDIGTGKVTKKEMDGIPHHLLDVENPKKVFTAAKFKELAEKAVGEISARGKLPIICGGTGFYIEALINDVSFPEVPPDKKLREKLDKKTAEEIFEILKKLDPKRAEKIDSKNKRRMIRSIEIAKKLGRVPDLDVGRPSKWEVLEIGIKTNDQILKEKIYKRLVARIKKGMVTEAEELHTQGLSWKRMERLGLEYRYLARFLQGKISENEMIRQLNTEIWHYARRQKSWFKRDRRIKWFEVTDLEKIEKEVENFLVLR